MNIETSEKIPDGKSFFVSIRAPEPEPIYFEKKNTHFDRIKKKKNYT